MVRTKSRWVCQQCGFQTSGFLGRCTECNTWNSLTEELIEEENLVSARKGFAARLPQNFASESSLSPLEAVSLDAFDLANFPGGAYRLTSGINGFDEVLGGGLVPGSVILLAGDPGIGKSTLLLQVAKAIATKEKVLYVSGEESAQQVCLRAQRLGISGQGILVNANQNVDEIRETIEKSKAKVVIIDSIQSIYHAQIASLPGSVTQVRETAALLVAAAKSLGVATILVGHVNKEGSIAGPRLLEHMVDVVLHFEGERTRQLRILKANKNRFGSSQEIAIFQMTQAGLIEVENASALLLGDRLQKLGKKQAASGTAVIASGQGNHCLLLEVQALVGVTTYPNPRRVANGWDYNRLLQIIAVLEKKVGLSLSEHDVYINVVGGLDISDPSGDLGIAVAIATSLLDRSIDPGLLLIGEVGLTGEVRPVPALAQHLKEAAKLGFRQAIVPQANLPIENSKGDLSAIGVEFLTEALVKAIPGHQWTFSQPR